MLKARHIECLRGNRRLFQNLSFQLEAKQALRIKGENGSGKTSLLRMVAGLSSVEGGEILWNDARIGDLEEEYRSDVLFLGHANGLKDELTPLENLHHALALAGAHAQLTELRTAMIHARLADAAELPVKVLSQGQRRRVALVRLAFSTRQKLWILDEPFSSLDASSIERTEQAIVAHLHRGGMVMFTTHQEVQLGGVKVHSVDLGAH